MYLDIIIYNDNPLIYIIINSNQIRAMVTALDDVVGNITRCLKDQKMYKNTIIIFSSDNGGIKQNKEGNWPLKGHYIILILQIRGHFQK